MKIIFSLLILLNLNAFSSEGKCKIEDAEIEILNIFKLSPQYNKVSNIRYSKLDNNESLKGVYFITYAFEDIPSISVIFYINESTPECKVTDISKPQLQKPLI